MAKFLKVGMLRMCASRVEHTVPKAIWYSRLSMPSGYGANRKINREINIDDFTKHMDILSKFKLKPQDFSNIMKINARNHQHQIVKSLAGLESLLNETGQDPAIIKYVTRNVLYSSYYEHGFEKWNITQATQDLNISGEDVFVSLLNDTPSSNQLSLFTYDQKLVKEDALRSEFQLREKEDNHTDQVFFDWYNGIGIKNHFPKRNGKDFQLNMRRFNDRNNNIGYPRIIGLFTRSVMCNFNGASAQG